MKLFIIIGFLSTLLALSTANKIKKRQTGYSGFPSFGGFNGFPQNPGFGNPSYPGYNNPPVFTNPVQGNFQNGNQGQGNFNPVHRTSGNGNNFYPASSYPNTGNVPSSSTNQGQGYPGNQGWPAMNMFNPYGGGYYQPQVTSPVTPNPSQVGVGQTPATETNRVDHSRAIKTQTDEGPDHLTKEEIDRLFADN